MPDDFPIGSFPLQPPFSLLFIIYFVVDVDFKTLLLFFKGGGKICLMNEKKGIFSLSAKKIRKNEKNVRVIANLIIFAI